MKRIMIALGLLMALNVSAQEDMSGVTGFPTVSITKRPCVENEGGSAAFAPGKQYSATTQQNAALSSMGSPKILVCLAEYTDVKFTVGKTADEVQDIFDVFFNGNNMGAGDNPHSVKDYFQAMSGGLFTPEFVITQIVTVPHERAYYGEVGSSGRRMTFRNDALTQLAPQIQDRMGELDTNGDGNIDGVIIVFPGCGANVGDKTGMHPVCWTNRANIAGISYATQLLGPELLGMDQSASGGVNNAKLNGIGVFVHEMSHMLGLPDFYDLNYVAPGMDYWSLMDYGEYWHDGYHPTPYTAYERHFMGWMPLVELSQPTYVSSMKAIGDGGSAYIIYNDANRDEYYILENRNTNDVWSKSLCTSLGSGLMIYHVDYDAKAWENNSVNTNVGRQRMTIVPANGHFELCDNLSNDPAKYISELRGHLWPLKSNESVVKYWGIAGNNALTDEERTEGSRIAPAAVLNTANIDGVKLMHKPITHMQFDYQSNTASFSFMGGTPVGISELDSDKSEWGDVPVKVYSLDGRMVSQCRTSQLDALPSGVYLLRNTATGEVTKRIVNPSSAMNRCR